MDVYLNNLIIGIIRVLIVFFVLVGVLPKFVYNGKQFKRRIDRFIANLLLMGGFSVGIIYFLVMAKLYDTVSLMLAFLLLFIINFLWKHRGRLRETFTLLNHTMLKFIESHAKLALKTNFKPDILLQRIKNSSFQNRIWNVLLMLLLIITALLRLIPVFRIAAPFSVESYKTLEYVKNLQIRSLFPDGSFILKGMHSLIDLFFQLTKTDHSILVHIFGVLSAVLLTYIIYYITCKLTQNEAVSIVAASVFGVFSGMLPLNIQAQVEANSIIIAACFALPGLFFLADYLLTANKMNLLIAGLGIAATFLINTFFASMVLLAFIPLMITFLIFHKETEYGKGRKTVFMLLLLMGGGLIAMFYTVNNNFILSETIRMFFADDNFNRYGQINSRISGKYIFYVSIVFSILLTAMGFFRKRKSYSFHVMFLGLYLFLITLLWKIAMFNLPDVFNKNQLGLLLSIMLCISAGIAIDFFLFKIPGKWLLLKGSENTQLAYSLIVFAIFAELFMVAKMPVMAKFTSYTEPDGFVRSIYAIQREIPEYQWTVVSHFGTKIQTTNCARYMDYVYFLENYHPETFNSSPENRLPTPYLFLFVEKDTSRSRIVTEILPHDHNLMSRMQKWSLEYRKHRDDMDIYYEDDTVYVYRISNDDKDRANRI